MGERVGILGGTFDPPHVGHLAAAVNVRHALALARVLLVPACVPWQKVGARPITPERDRLAMTRLTAEAACGLEVSTLEVDRGGESYSADTLEELAAHHPGAELFLVVGSDVARGLGTWMRPEVLRRAATTVVYERPGVPAGRPPAGWDHIVVPVPLLDVSSTDLRARVRDGRPVDGLVVPAVARYIRHHRLYREDRA